MIHHSKENSMRGYLFGRATTFKLSGLGKCSFRASYASLIFAQLFPDEARVHLVSNPKKDQFAVLLNIRNEWFVYDPLTNPEVLFPLAMYQKEILPKFPDVGRQVLEFKLKVTKAFAEEFFRKYPAILEKISKQFLAALPTPNEILNNAQCMKYIAENGISSQDLAPKISRALDLIRSFCPVERECK